VDLQRQHDAATKGYVDNGIAGMNTLATGKVYLETRVMWPRK
jgi:hypothetical protein